MTAKGSIWRFEANDINTDQIRAYMYSHLPVREQAKHCLESVNPDFAKNVKPGDIVVAGKNFGCGSSRPAFATFVELGVAAIVTESFGRIFYRHCISAGLLVIAAPGILDFTNDGERLEIDLVDSVIRNLSIQGAVLPFRPLPDFIREMVACGGEMPYLEARLARERGAA
jgi:3-isopropylmalate/(R)-2-methylmalate dehydratase small subunit